MSRIPNHTPTIETTCTVNADKSPNQTAFEDATESITWAELDRQSGSVANGFLEYATLGDRVAFLCESSVDHVVALVGALKAGCVVSNLHTKSATETLRHCIAQLRPKVLVVDERFSDRVRDALDADVMRSIATVVTIGEATYEYERPLEPLRSGGGDQEPDIFTTGDDPAFVWWTSGSTGKPKGWCHTHNSLYVKGMKAIGRTGIHPSGKSIVSFSPSFGAWTNVFLRTVYGCESTYLLRDWDPTAWLRAVDERDVTHGGLVVTMWKDVLDQDLDRYELDALKAIYTTGEKIDADTLGRLRREICPNVYQTYGSTELSGTTLYNDQMEGDRIASVGKPQMGTDLRIIEEGGSPDDELEPGEVGEIIIRGPDTPAWAWRDSQRVRDAFRDGWWYSRDLGYKDEDGYVYLEGRADAMIKSKGVKTMPAPIENVLTDHPDVEEAVVVGVDDEEYGQKITAIVQTDRDDLTPDDLETWCLESDELADHKRPRAFRFVESVATTPSGKIDRESTRRNAGLED